MSVEQPQGSDFSLSRSLRQRTKRKFFKSSLELKKSTMWNDQKLINELNDLIAKQTKLTQECAYTLNKAQRNQTEQLKMTKGFRLEPAVTLVDRSRQPTMFF